MKKAETLCHHHFPGSNSNPIYGLGVLGALYYFLSSANSFSEVMVGIFKSVFWPAVFMFEFLSNYQF